MKKAGTRMKAKLKTKVSGRVVPLSENRLSESVVSIGYDISGIKSGRQLKLKPEDLKKRVGGKASGLVEMIQMGIPVPPAFNLSTELCPLFLKRQELPTVVHRKVDLGLVGLEKNLKKKFGQTNNPLLVSVRSGAPVSMPGMMDTILNLGLHTHLVQELAKAESSQARFWWDCYRRLIFMFADVVLGFDKSIFDGIMDHEKARERISKDSDLSAPTLEKICDLSLQKIVQLGKEFPQNPRDQLRLAIEAVFRSWNSDRAVHYRRINHIPEDWGTSVTVQAMVFGNRNDQSGTGVVFTRNPSSGANELYGEYLLNAQGEDVVAGIRTPEPIDILKKALPASYKQLVSILQKLEKNFREVQDVEFTIENGRLFILQTRNAKRTAAAAVEHLVQFVKEKRIKKEEALLRFSVNQVNSLLHPSLQPTKQKPLGRGLPASPGAVSGRAVFDPETAQQMNRAQNRVILVRRETSPEDIMGMAVSEGILTATGGMTSHAAVVGRGMGKSCVVGCTDLRVDEHQKRAVINGQEIREGDLITINGSTGEIYSGELPTEAMNWTNAAKEFFSWADEKVKVRVLANADTPEQAKVARALGAQGIGLCRTEHMFFESERLRSFRKMILAEDSGARHQALEELLPHQKDDFCQILEAMKGLSVCVRLLDPPLHEFLPRHEDEAEIVYLSDLLRTTPSKIESRIQILSEQNPMLGHRGCRLAVTNPEIYQMQVEALALALCENANRGVKTHLKIMIPLVIEAKELAALLGDLREKFDAVLHREGLAALKKFVSWGTMIEMPRACIVADQIAHLVDFFSFGTNDLTQATMGLSRDDASKFLPSYIEKRIFGSDPFESLDVIGVGAMIRMAVEKGRQVKPKLDIGICGEHGGDPESIKFFNELSFNTVSCSPYRVPVARLALSQATLGSKKKGRK